MVIFEAERGPRAKTFGKHCSIENVRVCPGITMALSTLKYKSHRNDGPRFETKILLYEVRRKRWDLPYVSMYGLFIHPLEDLSVCTVRRPANNLDVTQLLAMFG